MGWRFERLRDSAVETHLRPYHRLLARVRALEPELRTLPDHEFSRRMDRLRPSLTTEPTPDTLVDLAALVREAARRAVGLRAYDVQVMAGLAMCRQRLVEMQTGEGKTLVALFPAVLGALQGRGQHVLTFNDYLARRDAAWMGPAFQLLGLSVGLIQEQDTPAQRRRAYRCDVTYATAREVGFDLLRDGVALQPEQCVLPPVHAAVVDEADALLVDEARVPMVLAGTSQVAAEDLRRLAHLVARLALDTDYEIQDDGRTVVLTDEGLDRCEAALGRGELHAEGNLHLLMGLHSALHAHALIRRDVDYIVRDGRIELVDDFTGRVVKDRQWPYGLQAALEAKENLEVHPEGTILASITVQHFLATYPRLSGMTATARPAAQEVREAYGLKTVVIPPNRPCIRVDLPDAVFPDLATKEDALVKEIESARTTGRPILVGTRTVAESEMLSTRLQGRGVPHRVLNARNDEEEAAIIAEAGRYGAVTISTNMAGRGTDIHLGGADESDHGRVAALGGLYVLGTNRHESLRIDQQLRGRSGRQGDPGSSRLFVSLDDDLMRRYGLRRMLPKGSLTRNPEGKLDNPGVARAVGWVQRIIEGQQATVRSQLRDYAEILEQQRLAVSRLRRELLMGERDPELPSAIDAATTAALNAALGPSGLPTALHKLTLHHLDQCWSDHLAFAANLRESIVLERLAHRDPLMEYGRQMGQAFAMLLETVSGRVAADLVYLASLDHGWEEELARRSRPASTWTYLLDDDPFQNNLGRMLAGEVGLGAWAALAWPLLLLWTVVRWLQGKKRGQSGRNQSGRNQSGRGQSGRGPSGRGQSGRDQSAKGQSGRDQSGRGQSGRDQSGRDQSGRDQSE